MGKSIRKIQPLITAPRSKKVAAYARVSSGKDAMLHSLSAQISYYSNYIQKQKDWEYVGVYADSAMTGTKDNRPELQRLLADCHNGNVDMIITKSISRFARNTVVLLETVRSLKDINVDVYFQEQGIHSISGKGEMILTLLATVAEEESRAVSENCKWRIRSRFKNGELANLRFMYGYNIKKGEISINPTEAKIVRMIFDDYILGTGTSAITRKLNQMNILTLRGNEWNEDKIIKIIKNEKYTGNALLQKRYVPNHLDKKQEINRGELPKYYAKNTHEAIISNKVFEQAQQILANNTAKYKNGRKPYREYPFSGLITCDNCGRHYRRKTTKYNVFWICSTYCKNGKDACASKQIPEDTLKYLSAEVLNIPEFDKAVFKSNIKELRIPADNVVVFIFSNGNKIEMKWKDISRKDSWTQEMRKKARNQTNSKGKTQK